MKIELDTNSDYQANVKLLELYTLEELMLRYKFNQSKVAKVMGISRGTLRVKLHDNFGNHYFRDAE